MLVKFLLFLVFPSEPDHSDLPTLPLHSSPLQLPPRAPCSPTMPWALTVLSMVLCVLNLCEARGHPPTLSPSPCSETRSDPQRLGS